MLLCAVYPCGTLPRMRNSRHLTVSMIPYRQPSYVDVSKCVAIFSCHKELIMCKIISVVLSALSLVSCNRKGPQDTSWPDISFVILDEMPGENVMYRTKNFAPTAKRVVLLPIVENHLWNGKRYDLAIADPIVVVPGEETLRKTLAHLSNDGQRVRRCIVLAYGYCPGTLHLTFNYSGMYHDKEVWLIELAKLSTEQYAAASQVMILELAGSKILVDGDTEQTIEMAIEEKQILGYGEIKSPIVGQGGHRNNYALWSLRNNNTEVAVCLSDSGRRVLQKELLEPPLDQDGQRQEATSTTSHPKP